MNDRSRDGFDLDELLHPASAFGHPTDVVRDPDLTLNEKRAILASCLSDACAVDSAPAFRKPLGGKVVTFDDVVDALRSLDAEAEKAHWKPQGQLRRPSASTEVPIPGMDRAASACLESIQLRHDDVSHLYGGGSRPLHGPDVLITLATKRL